MYPHVHISTPRRDQAYMHTCTSTRTSICATAHTYICTFTHTYTYTHMHMYVCMQEINIKSSCKALTYENHARLAIALANCHLSKAGLRTYPCTRTSDLLKCTQAIGTDSVAFSTYNTFFAHVRTACVLCVYVDPCMHLCACMPVRVSMIGCV